MNDDIDNLPELTEEEQAALNSFPADSVDHWMRGEWWDGEKWLPERPRQNT